MTDIFTFPVLPILLGSTIGFGLGISLVSYLETGLKNPLKAVREFIRLRSEKLESWCLYETRGVPPCGEAELVEFKGKRRLYHVVEFLEESLHLHVFEVPEAGKDSTYKVYVANAYGESAVFDCNDKERVKRLLRSLFPSQLHREALEQDGCEPYKPIRYDDILAKEMEQFICFSDYA